MSTQGGSAVDSVIRFEPGEYMIEECAYDEAHQEQFVYTVHERTAKTVTITGPTLEERNVTRRLQVVDGEEWFTSGHQVGARDRNGARSRLEAPAPQELEQTNDDSRPTDAELWDLTGILYGEHTQQGPARQYLYEQLVSSNAAENITVEDRGKRSERFIWTNPYYKG